MPYAAPQASSTTADGRRDRTQVRKAHLGRARVLVHDLQQQRVLLLVCQGRRIRSGSANAARSHIAG
jgi:hypothetical protein